MRVGETISHCRVVEQIGGGKKRSPFLVTPATEGAPRFSRDGRWFEELKRFVPVH
jgi:hypothetical protein